MYDTPPRHLYLIGLTGNIACGKSSVIAILRECGAIAIDADAVVHQLQQPGTAVYQQIVATFGADICNATGHINRQLLGTRVFGNQEALQQLEEIVHPAVHQHIYEWLHTVASTHTPPVAVIDAIKLLETHWHTVCQSVWVVTCQQQQQYQRLMHNRGLSEEAAHARIMAQPTQESRIPYANVVIDNSGTREATRTHVMAAWQHVLQHVPHDEYY